MEVLRLMPVAVSGKETEVAARSKVTLRPQKDGFHLPGRILILGSHREVRGVFRVYIMAAIGTWDLQAGVIHISS
jgi:hypothetical protein